MECGGSAPLWMGVAPAAGTSAGLGDASMLALDFKKVAAVQKGAYAEMDAVMSDLVAVFKEDVPA